MALGPGHYYYLIDVMRGSTGRCRRGRDTVISVDLKFRYDTNYEYGSCCPFSKPRTVATILLSKSWAKSAAALHCLSLPAQDAPLPPCENPQRNRSSILLLRLQTVGLGSRHLVRLE